MKKTLFAFAALECCALSLAGAAPLDAFLSANQNTKPGTGRIEAGYDVSNDTVDVFKFRKESTTSNPALGDYTGGHLSGGIAVTPQLWLDGAIWRRAIEARSFDAKVNTWQVAAQYKLFDAAGYRPHLALRLGAWGNSADSLSREKNIKVGSTVLRSASLSSPDDKQFQADLIATWPVSARTELTAFGSAGTSKVSYDTATATTSKDGCLYNLTFTSTHVVGVCETATSSVRFSTPNSVYGVNIDQEARYTARFYQAGMMAQWRNKDWQLRAGYQYQHIDRGQVDDIVVKRGGVPYKNNHVVVADVSYRVYKRASVFLRGQFMAKQFSGEMPMAYNSLTANSFDQRYGIVSAGLNVSF